MKGCYYQLVWEKAAQQCFTVMRQLIGGTLIKGLLVNINQPSQCIKSYWAHGKGAGVYKGVKQVKGLKKTEKN